MSDAKFTPVFLDQATIDRYVAKGRRERSKAFVAMVKAIFSAPETAETKIKRYKRGVEYYEWQKEKSQRNEALDCRVYNLAAIRLLQANYGVKLKEKLVIRSAEPALPPPPAPEPEKPATTLNSARKSSKRPRKSGFTNGWRK